MFCIGSLLTIVGVCLFVASIKIAGQCFVCLFVDLYLGQKLPVDVLQNSILLSALQW